jgi:hypothetical protein
MWHHYPTSPSYHILENSALKLAQALFRSLGSPVAGCGQLFGWRLDTGAVEKRLTGG